MMAKRILILNFFFLSSWLNSQVQDTLPTSNIQEYTPSKLMALDQWDVKWYNNLYTETKSTFVSGKEPRKTFFTSSLEVYTGIGKNKRWNIGGIVELRSNVIDGRPALDVFKFDGEEGTARSGLTSIAPSVKFVPFAALSNLSIQSSFHISLIDNEVENGVFLDQKGFIWQNRLFYDYTFDGQKWQLFSELNTEFSFGKAGESFANNSLNLVPAVYLSYFPSPKFTILGLVQYANRIALGNDFPQHYTTVGGGAKYQMNHAWNLELLYTNFVSGHNTGLGETFNLGLRGIF